MDRTARDMDVVRSVLGGEQLSYYGVSYGSKLGYHYSQLFPGNVRNVVIDSSSNQFQNNLDDLEKYKDTDYVPSSSLNRGAQQGVAIEQTFRNYLRSCLEGDRGSAPAPDGTPAVGGGGRIDGLRYCPLSGTTSPIKVGTSSTDAEVEAAYTTFQTLTRNAVGNPHYFHANDPDRPVPFDELVMGVKQAMYAEWRWDDLGSALARLVQDKDAQGLLDLADAYYGRTWNADKDRYDYPASAQQPGRFETLLCADMTPDGYSAGVSQLEAAKQYDEAAPWTWDGREPSSSENPSNDADSAYCTLFADSVKLAPGEELTNLPPTLVAGGTWDFATPFWNSVITADAMNGYLLIVAQSTHGAYWGGHQCALNLMSHYYDVGAVRFDQEFKNGKLNGLEFTGASNVRTKNMRSEEIIGNECQLISFRNGENGVLPPTEPEPEPSEDPTDAASPDATEKPSTEPTGQPSAEPTGKPTTDPDGKPGTDPDGEPSSEPVVVPSTDAGADPVDRPSADPTCAPSEEQTAEPGTDPGDQRGAGTAGEDGRSKGAASTSTGGPAQVAGARSLARTGASLGAGLLAAAMVGAGVLLRARTRRSAR